MKKDYKIAFIDIDWTILNHENGHYFDMESIDAIKKAQEEGLLIYFCTARTYASITFTGLFDLIKPNGIICTNGNVMFIEDNLFEALIIPESIVKNIFFSIKQITYKKFNTKFFKNQIYIKQYKFSK